MPTMDEMAQALGLCEFCGSRAGLLCDGKLPEGGTCNKKICRSHARMMVHVNKGRQCCDTRDLCPDCVAAGRTVY